MGIHRKGFKKFDQSFLDELKERSRSYLIDLVSGYTDLKKIGSNHKGLCLFHEEKTPSFFVNESKGFCHCFGCGWSGNALKFLMEMGASFSEAVKELARLTNTIIRYEDGSGEDFLEPLPLYHRKKSSPVKEQVGSVKDFSRPLGSVIDSVNRLSKGESSDAKKCREWLEEREITSEMMNFYKIGLSYREVTPNREKPEEKERYPAITIYIPVTNRPGYFHVKKRPAPWLSGEERPEYLAKWSQFGVPATIWFTYKPEKATETWFCEGEWDAIALGALLKEVGTDIAVACSTAGCSTVPKQEELQRLPGNVIIFYDRNDKPNKKTGLRAGDEGARKLAIVLGDRAKIAHVPMPKDCEINGWDVSNALEFGFRYLDFYSAASSAHLPTEEAVGAALTNPAPALPKDKDKKRRGASKFAWKKWRERRGFLEDMIENSQWVNWSLPSNNQVFFGKAGLGRGKTTLFCKWVAQLKAQGARRFFVLGYRNSLLHQTAAQLVGQRFLHIQDDAILRSDEDTSFCLCVDSLLKFQPEDFDGAIIFLDEVCSVIRHLLQSETLKGKRDAILDRFREALSRARVVICFDGLLNKWAVNYVGKLCPKKEIVKASNNFKAKKQDVTLVIGTQPAVPTGKDDEVKVNDNSPLISAAINSPRPAICSDSQVLIEALDIMFTKQGAKVLRIDSKTVPEAYVKAFLANCNEYLEKNEIDVLLYSPSAESGLNVSLENYFSHHYGLFFGVQGVDAILQMMGRIRDVKVPKIIWAKEWVPGEESKHSRSAAPGRIREDFLHVLCYELSYFIEKDSYLPEEALKIIKHSIDQSILLNDHNKTAFILEAISNFEKANLRECLLEALKAEGHRVCVKVASSDDVIKKEAKESKEIVKRQNAKDIFSAKVEDPEALLQQNLAYDATWEKRCERTKALLMLKLPGMELTESWSEDFIYREKYEDRNIISQCEMEWLYKNDSLIEENRTERRLFYLAKQNNIFIADLRSRFSRIKLLKQLNFDRFFSPTAQWQADTPELLEFIDSCKDEVFSSVLGCRPGVDPIKFVNKLLAWFGYKLKKSSTSTRGRGEKRIYELDLSPLSDSDRIQIRKCVEKKFTAKDQERPDWELMLKDQRSTLPDPEIAVTEPCRNEEVTIEQLQPEPMGISFELAKKSANLQLIPAPRIRWKEKRGFWEILSVNELGFAHIFDGQFEHHQASLSDLYFA